MGYPLPRLRPVWVLGEPQARGVREQPVAVHPAGVLWVPRGPETPPGPGVATGSTRRSRGR